MVVSVLKNFYQFIEKGYFFDKINLKDIYFLKDSFKIINFRNMGSIQKDYDKIKLKDMICRFINELLLGESTLENTNLLCFENILRDIEKGKIGEEINKEYEDLRRTMVLETKEELEEDKNEEDDEEEWEDEKELEDEKDLKNKDDEEEKLFKRLRISNEKKKQKVVEEKSQKDSENSENLKEKHEDDNEILPKDLLEMLDLYDQILISKIYQNVKDLIKEYEEIKNSTITPNLNENDKLIIKSIIKFLDFKFEEEKNVKFLGQNLLFLQTFF